MAHLDEANLILAGAQGFHDAVDAVAGKTKDKLHSPINKPFNKNVGSSHIDFLLLFQMPVEEKSVATGRQVATINPQRNSGSLGFCVLGGVAPNHMLAGVACAFSR